MSGKNWIKNRLAYRQGGFCSFLPQTGDEEAVCSVFVREEGDHTVLGTDVRDLAILGGEYKIEGFKFGVSREEGLDHVPILGGEDGTGGVDQHTA